MPENLPPPAAGDEAVLPPIEVNRRPSGSRESFRGLDRLAPPPAPGVAADAPAAATAVAAAPPGATADPRRDAFETELLRAWIATRIEHDRSLLTLASGGVGLLIGLVKLAPPAGRIELALHVVAFAAFLLTIVACLLIFRCNSAYLERVARRAAGADSRLVRTLDAVALSSFLLGVAAAAATGLLHLWA
jgi:hypothetical protein